MKPAAVWALIGAFIGFGSFSAWGAPQGRVALSQAAFISPDYQQTTQKDFQFFSAGFDTLNDIRQESEIEDTLHAQARGMVSPGTPVLNYLNVSQLFWKQEMLTVGRKKMNWNRLDEDFALGIYQPVFKWNPLQRESQGLTGLFVHLETQDEIPWGVTLFGSPVFIPNQGASYEVQDGAFRASNPYFSSPPHTAFVNDQEFEINYDIQKPAAEDIVFHQSFATRLFVGRPEKGIFAQISYAQKPMNELNLAFMGYAPAETQKVNVDILPAVTTHKVTSLDLQYGYSQFRTGISALQEEPNEPSFKDEWTYATFKKSTLVSPFMEVKGRNLEMQLVYLSVQGGDSIGNGPEADQAMKFIPQLYPFRNAGQLAVKYQYRMKRNEVFAVASKYLRGEAGEFDLWTTQATYQWRRGWAVSFTSQMLAVEDSDKGNRTAYQSYVDNDLMAMGVSYVF